MNAVIVSKSKSDELSWVNRCWQKQCLLRSEDVTEERPQDEEVVAKLGLCIRSGSCRKMGR
jgi:hypothetical protein